MGFGKGQENGILTLGPSTVPMWCSSSLLGLQPFLPPLLMLLLFPVLLTSPIWAQVQAPATFLGPVLPWTTAGVHTALDQVLCVHSACCVSELHIHATNWLISCARTQVPLVLWTLLMNHKLKDKIIKNIKTPITVH